MAITSDGTQAFGIESSPVTINSVTYISEGLNFSLNGNRSEIADSNGEPIGATVVDGLTEVSGTLQLATGSTAVDIRQHSMTLSGTRNDGEYVIVSCSEAETQGDYVKLSFNAYKKLN